MDATLPIRKLLKRYENANSQDLGKVLPACKTSEVLYPCRKPIEQLLRLLCHIPESKILDGNWNIDQISAGLDQLLDDPDVNIIIAYGEVSSSIAVFREKFSKPVIAAIAINSELENMPLRDGTSGCECAGSGGAIDCVPRAVHQELRVTPLLASLQRLPCWLPVR